MAFEKMIAPVIYTAEEKGRPDFFGKALNYFTHEELRALEGNLPILEGLAADGFPEQDCYLFINPAYVKELNALYTEENLNLIKDFLIVRGSIDSVDMLDRECHDWGVEMNNAITGASGTLDDVTACSNLTSSTLAWPTVKFYASVYLSEEDKERIADMIGEVKAAYYGIIEEADFLSDETRAKAIEKLDAMRYYSLYPDDWGKYSCEALEIKSVEEGGTLWEANRNHKRYLVSQAIQKLSEPVDKEKWLYPPHTIKYPFGISDL